MNASWNASVDAVVGECFAEMLSSYFELYQLNYILKLGGTCAYKVNQTLLKEYKSKCDYK